MYVCMYVWSFEIKAKKVRPLSRRVVHLYTYAINIYIYVYTHPLHRNADVYQLSRHRKSENREFANVYQVEEGGGGLVEISVRQSTA